MINKVRRWIIKKLIKEKDGYVQLGLVDGEPMNFYYDENMDKYVLGKRCGNFYYTELRICGWCSYMSRYLPWSENLKEPKIVPFIEWIYGIAEQINKECRELINLNKS